MTQSGYIRFFSNAPLEDIEAENNKVRAALDITTGEVVFMITIKDFVFDKSLMQQHFNENYMESDKYPNAQFKGKIRNLESVKFDRDGKYAVTVFGELIMHGVEKEILADGYLEVVGELITISSVFVVQTADYEIKIPKIMFSRIAEEIEVTVDADLEKLK
jgi:polyisoprenoid-binding protein YceI